MASVILRVFLMLLMRPLRLFDLPSITMVPRVIGDRTLAGTKATATESNAATMKANDCILTTKKMSTDRVWVVVD
jgi:hypothetical protein